MVEADRLRALRDLNLLDTSPCESFDRITRMASLLFSAPISAISLTDENRQWFKSRVGCGPEIPRYKAPCAEVTRIADVLVVPDLTKDCRFEGGYLADNGIRFYAGAPLTTRDGFTLGSMCVLDTKPRMSAKVEDAAALKDLAAMVMAQIELQHSLGRIDPASGLPNRNQFAEDVEDMALDYPHEERVAVLFDLVDPARLAQAMRVLGPRCLDELIHNALKALKQRLSPAALYQVGASQFVAILAGHHDESDHGLLVAQFEHLKREAAAAGLAAMAGVAIGIATFRLGEMDPAELLRSAHAAAQDARQSETGVSRYCPATNAVHERNFELIAGLREALTGAEQLTLVYQPTVNLRSGECDGAEALLRWRHPVLGDISPAEFVPLAEQTELAKPLTALVVDTALKQSAAWHREGLQLRVSVNVSAANLEEETFASGVIAALRRHGVLPSRLKVEFTESALITQRALVLKNLGKLRDAGISCAIDDFGTGYSSFSYLQDIPADTIKIDKSFIQRIEHSSRDRSLVTNIIKMASELGFRVVAEGVETRKVYDFLRETQCSAVQGYLISRPLPADDLMGWLAAWQPLGSQTSAA
ncbi:GGDEF and EAL domain-containing protein [Hyphomicrobium sp. NDB2Meth4]|uniref:sensor domain-containing phosphodiesterase n=1 Tax=Hyphomicrobium sp. NDB2Meth4 TaxID=1892846 RepID=UPI000931C740|nr:GGDEF and EAL domain-containing protein [Hyphomicrobium sp. NDB2Meth4]